MRLPRAFHRLRFFVADAWDEWRRSPGINLLAVATLASTLFLAGLVVLVTSNLGSRAEQLRDEVRVDVFLDNEIDPEIRIELMQQLESMEGVARVVYVDQLQALERYQTWAGNVADLAEELEVNPLPASFEVYLAPGADAEARGDAVAERFGAQAGVEEVSFNREWLQRLEAMLRLVRVGTVALALLVFTAVVFIMASVLRLAVHARRDEIDIMLLVGATPGFIRGPFLVAGLAQGLVCSGVALLLVEGARRGMRAYAGGSITLLDLVAARSLPLEESAVLVLIGLLVSLVGAWFAVRRAV